MRVICAGVLAAFLVSALPAGADPRVQIVAVRGGYAAFATLRYSDPVTQRHAGKYDIGFMRPPPLDTNGFIRANGGTVTGPVQPDLADVSKPWVIFTHTRANGDIACHTLTNISAADFTVSDATYRSELTFRVSCPDGADRSFQVAFQRFRPYEFQWSVFSYARGWAWGDRIEAAVHGMVSYVDMQLCGDVTGCRMLYETADLWRVYEATVVASAGEIY